MLVPFVWVLMFTNLLQLTLFTASNRTQNLSWQTVLFIIHSLVCVTEAEKPLVSDSLCKHCLIPLKSVDQTHHIALHHKTGRCCDTGSHLVLGKTPCDYSDTPFVVIVSKEIVGLLDGLHHLHPLYLSIPACCRTCLHKPVFLITICSSTQQIDCLLWRVLYNSIH